MIKKHLGVAQIDKYIFLLLINNFCSTLAKSAANIGSMSFGNVGPILAIELRTSVIIPELAQH